jgi:tripartite-type tricarboxylate transporter receptor subunit TctC
MQLNRALWIAALGLVLPLVAAAQSYPIKSVRLIVPFTAGGSTDTIARVVAQKMGEGWPQQIVIDNRPGAASSLGTELAARAPADGYTLLMGTPGLTSNPSLYSNTSFHPVRDFSPIVLLCSVPIILVAHPSLPVRSVQDLIKLAKARPRELNYASNGSSTHLTAELFLQRAGISIQHVPYKGSAPATNDLIGGQIQLSFDSFLSAFPHVKSGKLRALAVTSANRSALAPEVPALAELGFPGFDASSWFGILAPAGTPKAIVDQLNAKAQAVLQSPDVREKLSNLGAGIAGLGPEPFAAFIAAEFERIAKLVKERNIKAD